MAGRLARALRTSMVFLLLIAIFSTDALAASISVKINTANTKVYASASTSAKYVKVKKNLKVTLKAYSNGWGKVVYKGRTGYVKLKYLNRTTPLKAYAAKNTTVYKYANSSKKLTSISKGTALYVIGLDGNYTRVQNKSGSVVGYVKTSAVTSKKPAVSSSSTSSSAASGMPSSLKSTTSKNGSSNTARIEYVIYVAQNQLGKPYSTDSNVPKSFDCATFTHYCYDKAKNGYIKSSAKTQGYDSRMDKISYSNLKRGDVVCFNTVSSDEDLSDHVGIYLGSGYFIHASSSAGKVIVSSMSSGYYKRTFSWGRRVFG